MGALKDGQNRLERKVDRILSRLRNGGWALALAIVIALLAAHFPSAFSGAG